MSFRVGSSVKNAASGAELIIVRAPGDDGDFRIVAGVEAELLLGKRYRCSHCGAEALVAKPGSAKIVCHSEPLTLAPAKALPSSD
jgi:hypothetical protein